MQGMLAGRAWFLTWIAYATYYTGRKGFSVSKKTIATEYSISEQALGAIDTVYLTAYALGQFVSGALGDRIGARRLVGYGMLGSALACAAFGVSGAALAFGFWFLLNGAFQSTGWPGTTRAMAEWTTPQNRGTVMAFWSTCYQLGGIAATWLCGTLLVYWGFRSAFYGPALLMALVGLAILFWLPRPPPAEAPSGALMEGPHDSIGPPHVERADLIRSAQRAVWRSTLLWSYGASYFFIKFIRYALLFWLPYYLETALHYGKDSAFKVASAFEVGGVVGVVIIGILSDRIRVLSRSGLAATWLVGLAFSLFLYIELAHRGMWMNALGLGLVGAMLFGPDSILAGAAAQDAGGRHASATATGMVNGLGSIGAIAEGLVIPQISGRLGWQAVFPVLVVLALGAALALIPALLRQPRAGTT